ncbi:MAG: hypothetical protein AB2604_10760 [Candidatus Thiodiazotropha taylori]
MDTKTTVVAYPFEANQGFNVAFKAGSLCASKASNEVAHNIEHKERARFEEWLNDLLTKSFEMGVEHQKKMAQ